MVSALSLSTISVQAKPGGGLTASGTALVSQNEFLYAYIANGAQRQRQALIVQTTYRLHG